MYKILKSKGTEFAQNGKDLVIIDTKQRGGKPIMLNSKELDEALKNGQAEALNKIDMDKDVELENSFECLLDNDILGKGVSKLPPTLKSIRAYGFYNCTNLDLAELPDGIEYLGTYAFMACPNIKFTKIPSSVKHIGLGCFQGVGIENLTMSTNNFESMGTTVFSGCKSLKAVTISQDEHILTDIPDSTFNGCMELEDIILPDTIETIGQNAFNNAPLTNLHKLPTSLKTIGSSAFRNCKGLPLTELPEGITTLKGSCFMSCSALAITLIPESVKSLDSSVFQTCYNIPYMIIKGARTSLPKQLFYECSGLAWVSLPDVTAVPTLSSANTFYYTPIHKKTGFIYVPDTLVDSFKAATNWSTYADQIKPISELEV